MLYNSHNTPLFITFILLSVLTLLSQAKDPPDLNERSQVDFDFLQPSNKLDRDIFYKAEPSVLMCIVKSEGDKVLKAPRRYIGQIVVNPSDVTKTPHCHYLTEDSEENEFIDYQWLDAGYYELFGFLETHAHKVSQPGQKTFYVMRKESSDTNAICAYVENKKGKIIFGYEFKENDIMHCSAEDSQKESPVYYHTYRRFICHDTDTTETEKTESTNTLLLQPQSADEVDGEPGGCHGIVFIPECHNCSDGGCSAFECSSFTHWDPCPKGSKECGTETCVGGFCTSRRWCEETKKAQDWIRPRGEL